MPTFDVYTDIIVPSGEALQSDSRFQGCKIFYDRSIDRAVARDLMPAINYFLEAPWEDIARGSGSSSLKRRTHTVRLGFGVWVCESRDPARLDSRLFSISGDLLDFFWEHRLWQSDKSIVLRDSIRWDVNYIGGDTDIVGSQKLSVEFEMLGG